MEKRKTPRIRFKGFSDDWEQRKLGEMADYKKGPFGSALKKEIFVPEGIDTVKVYEQQNAINKDWRFARYFITREYAQKLSNFETHAGDIIVSCAGTIGEIYELPHKSKPGIINQALMRIRVNEGFITKDLYKIIFSNKIDEFSAKMSNGSAMKNIPHFADLKGMIADIPSMKEQYCMGNFFSNFDTLITFHQRQQNSWKLIEKGVKLWMILTKNQILKRL
ncbi:restriction endonuclease subunit S [uncultured Veillonella sp.]|uniref:restriction endonuclease subunit S n=1 Tax=uncultured Veillonella sp. TaxID=159268 RepID=UPI002600F609|nr:restriction endonuclease subunit S [uncultured Veillonella sp.]